MPRKIKSKWICDLCGREQEQPGFEMPSLWSRFTLICQTRQEVYSGSGIFVACPACSGEKMKEDKGPVLTRLFSWVRLRPRKRVKNEEEVKVKLKGIVAQKEPPYFV